MSTCMGWTAGYYDEAGEWVFNRDPNWHTTSYRCSRGHSFDIVRRDGDADVVRVGADVGKGPCWPRR